MGKRALEIVAPVAAVVVDHRESLRRIARAVSRVPRGTAARRSFWLVAVLFCLTTSVAANTNVSFEASAVVARVTPGARTAWFSVEHLRRGYRHTIVDRALILADEDRDGVVRLTLDEPSSRSVWMIVDLSNGRYAIASPGDRPPHRRPLRPAAVRARTETAAARVLQPLASSIVWFVRPGVGAWVAMVDDGSQDDADAAVNGEIAAQLSRMTPVDNSPPPPEDVQRDDVVVIIEPQELYVFEMRVAK